MNKTIAFLLVLIALALGGGAWYLAAHRTSSAPSGPVGQTVGVPEGATVVTLTPDGFQPSEITVKAGTVVAFRTTAGKPFWPASNPHPSHTLYPEFDPQDPVAPDAAWTFTFDKVGDWGYHDHLAPYFTGTVHVTQ